MTHEHEIWERFGSLQTERSLMGTKLTLEWVWILLRILQQRRLQSAEMKYMGIEQCLLYFPWL